jgi:hypothetical protein
MSRQRRKRAAKNRKAIAKRNRSNPDRANDSKLSAGASDGNVDSGFSPEDNAWFEAYPHPLE